MIPDVGFTPQPLPASIALFAPPLREAALAKYPEETPRIERGYVLMMAGHVLRCGESFLVLGSRGHYYHVNGSCECIDSPRAPGQRCKHWWAVALSRRTVRAFLDAQSNRQMAEPDYSVPYYATYFGGGMALNGLAIPCGPDEPWFFVPDGEQEGFWCDLLDLTLGGRPDIANAQAGIDGNLVEKVCGNPPANQETI